ncbi:NIF domain-containing protein [Arthroderma uncinatum]|uniref:NIF domain-containing protein n=1 Tax=Arthroderma uncinatum TaxID=74035 RepID=UPI00144AAE2A|nr:NIF domain-containing protein [Arthroderma uncinatum]KAF3480293.1 NIF domain-containing protein [Arthroderma uncinatum]
MSAESRPIDPAAFAEALQDLPLSSVFAKIAEVENSTAHLERSNLELRRFIQESPDGETECEEAVAENEVVIGRMRERVRLVKLELERRGEKWPEPASNLEDEEAETAGRERSSADGQGLSHDGPPASSQANEGSNGVMGSPGRFEGQDDGPEEGREDRNADFLVDLNPKQEKPLSSPQSLTTGHPPSPCAAADWRPGLTTMNSLNILSSRVIGQATANNSPRARSRSQDGIANPRGDLAASRSYSEGNINQTKQLDGALDEDEEQDAFSRLTEDADQKPALAQELQRSGSAGMILPITQQFFDALIETLKTILSIFSSPAVYVSRRFRGSDGQFSILEPLRSLRQAGRKNNSPNTDQGRNSRGLDKGSKTRYRGPQKMQNSLSSESIYSNTSESETDRSLSGEPDVRNRHSRRKSSLATTDNDEGTPRRSIRIKIQNESKQNREQRQQTRSKSSRRNDMDSSPVADSLKSPVSPAVRKLTRYPHAPTPPRPLIPRRQPSYLFGAPPSRSPQKTLILDLDETLIHSLSKGGRMSSGHMVEVKLSVPMATSAGPGASPTILGPQHPILYYVHKRPHCDAFLRKVCQWYKLVVFTASVQEYADPVIDWLEQERKYFHSRYYRQHCTIRNGAYIKDLSSVEPDLNNAIPIEGWINDPTDNDLLHLIPILEAMQHVTDVRALLALRRGEAGS